MKGKGYVKAQERSKAYGVLCSGTNFVENCYKNRTFFIMSKVQIYLSLSDAANLEIEQSLLSTRVSLPNVTKTELKRSPEIMVCLLRAIRPERLAKNRRSAY